MYNLFVHARRFCLQLAVNQLMATMLAAFAETIVLTEALDLSIPDLIEVL